MCKHFMNLTRYQITEGRLNETFTNCDCINCDDNYVMEKKKKEGGV